MVYKYESPKTGNHVDAAINKIMYIAYSGGVGEELKISGIITLLVIWVINIKHHHCSTITT